MAEAAEIKVERQPGGWIWIAVMSTPGGDAARIIAQSPEALENREAALADACRVMRALGLTTMDDSGTV
ncbi:MULTISPECIES: hypothetical protein [unclassified Caballeronia]|jgi:hypothetical protein|uniref:hypothetical protein n=1 Tax=unclassified Caballeronia TaxID=2646786 RepID=UPI002027894E|nr:MULTISPECIES: hypothetical protein [unclassified Caballeronia]